MSDFLRVLLDSIAYIWPLRMVKTWQRGGYYVFGRYWREVGAGVYPVIPWFFEVHEVDICEAIIGTSRQDITLSDGSMLSFTATATVQVVNVRAALNVVAEYKETAREALASVLADRLAAVDAARLEHGGRGRLFADLRRWVGEELEPYGIEVKKVRFTSFITNAKSHRLIIDQADAGAW